MTNSEIIQMLETQDNNFKHKKKKRPHHRKRKYEKNKLNWK